MDRHTVVRNLVIAKLRNCFAALGFGAALFLVVATTFVAPQPATAAIDQLPFSARLTTTSGSNVADGTYSINFRLYTTASGGAPIWNETHSTSVSRGEFAVYLGSVTSFTGVDFNQSPLYLAFKVGSDTEMSPRYELGSVPSALNSSLLNGRGASAYFQKDQNETVSGNTTFSGSSSFTGAADFTGAVAIQPAALTGDALTVNSASGFVGNLLNLKRNNVTQLSVNQNGNLSTVGSLTAGAGLTVTTGGATISAGGLSVGGNTVITGNLTVTGSITGAISGGVDGSVQYTNTFVPSDSSMGWAIAAQGAPMNTPNAALISLGDGGFAGAANGFVGSADGTVLGINTDGAFTGNLIDFQVAGVSQFKATSSGQVTTANTLTVTSGGLVVNAGGITATGNSSVVGTFNVSGLVTAQNGLTVSAGGASIAGGLTVTGGASVSGGLNNNNGGITNTGAISGATTGGFSGNVTVGGTLAVTSTINGASISGGTFSGGNVSGGTITGGQLSASAVNGLSVASGVISAGTWNGSVVDVAYGGTGANSFTANGLLYGNGSSALQVTAAGTSGQMLVANVSGVPTFVTLSGDATLAANGALTLATVNSNTGSYGSATQVPVVTVDAKGRITAVNNTTISGVAPGGTASGDLSGSYPNPTVAKINGVTLGDTTAIAGNLLIGSGTEWVSQTLSGDATVDDLGVLTVANGAITNAKLQNSSIAVSYGTGLSGSASVALGGTLTVNNTGVTSLTGTANQISVSGSTGSVTLSLPQNIATTSTPIFAGMTLNGTLTVASGGASISGGIDNNSDGITNAGDISGTGDITPDADDTRDLGASGNKFANLYATNVNFTNLQGSYSEGSVLFSGPGGTISQDNSNLYWDDSIDSLGVGTQPISGYKMSIASTGVLMRLERSTSGSGANFISFSNPDTTNGNTSLISASTVTTGTGGGDNTLVRFGARFDQHDHATRSGSFVVSLANGGSATEKFTILGNGNVGIGDSTPTALLSVGSGDVFQVTAAGAIAASTGITTSGALTVSAGGATIAGGLSVTGGINNNSGGITNTGAISGASTITASGAVTAGSLTDGTLTVSSGAITGGTTAVFSTSTTTGIVYGGTGSAGNLSLQSTSHVTKGNVYFNGTTAYVDASSNLFGAGLNVGSGTITSGLINGQTISSSASFTGTVTAATGLTVSAGGAGITGNITLAGNLLPSGSRDVGASGNRFTNGYFDTVDVNNLTVNTGSTVNGQFTVSSATSPQLTVKYDNSNYYTSSVSSAGAVTFDAVGSGAAFTFSDSVTANVLNSSGVVITGGTINGTTIGASTPSTGAFTGLTSSGATTLGSAGNVVLGYASGTFQLDSTGLDVSTAGALSGVTSIGASGNITTSGNVVTTGTGTITAANGATITAGGLTVTAGGINNNSGGVTNAGSITGVGANITASGAVTLQATSGALALSATGTNVITFSTNGSEGFRLTSSGNLEPNADNTRNLGASGVRWANVFATNVTATSIQGSYTQGSVLFAGSGGTLTQDNTNFFFDNTTKGLKVNGLVVRSANIARRQAGALNFGGTGGARVSHQITAGTIGTSDVTLSFRFEVPSDVSGSPVVGSLTSSSSSAAQAGAFQVYFTSSGQLIIRLRGALSTDIRDKRVDNFATTYAGQIVDVHVIKTAAGIDVYANGVLQTTTENTSGTPPAWGDAITGPYFVLGSGNASAQTLRTKMYTARFYNRALTQSDIYREIQEGPAVSDRYGNLTGPVAGLVIDSDLANANPAVSTVVSDLSSNSFVGTAAGSPLPIQTDPTKRLFVASTATISDTLTVVSGGAAITGNSSVTGTFGTTGTTTLASGAGANTVIGNTTGTLQLESTNFDVSTGGNISTAGTYIQSGVGTNLFGGIVRVGSNASAAIPDGAGSTFIPSIQAAATSGAVGISALVSDGTNNRRAGLIVDNTNNLWGITSTYSSGASPFIIREAAVEWLRITSGNLSLGSTSASARLDVKGSGNTSATNALYVQNSSSTALLTVRNDGLVTVGNGLTVTTGGATITGTVAVTGALSSTGNTTLSSGAGSTTTIGNTTGTLQLESTNFDLSTAGSIATNGGYVQSGTNANTLSGATSFTASGTALAVTNNATIGGTLNGQTISSAASFTGTVAVATSITVPTIQTASGNLALQASSGIVALNKSGTQNKLQVYDTSGTKYVELTHDGTNAVITASSGELQLGGSGSSGNVYIGEVGSAANLVFEESSTISGQGTNTITLGQSGDTFNLNQTGVTYNIGTLTATGAILNTSSTSTTALVINGPTSLGSNLLDLQVNSSSKLSVSASGALTTAGSVTSSVTGANALALTGAPAASASSSLLQLGSAIGSGSASGTFIGLNAANGYAGNLADWQVNSSSKFKVDASGNLTISGTLTGPTTGTLGYWSRSGTTLQPGTSGDAITTSGNISTTGSGTITAANGLTVTAGGLTVTAGGINNTSGGITNAGSITGIGTALTATAGVTLQASAGTLSLAAGSTNDITLTTNSVERIRVNSIGSVGIGDSTKLARLTVRNVAAFSATGTTSTNASQTITGSGTAFLTEVGIGDRIALSSASSTYATVTAIGTNTSLTVDAALGNGTSQTITVQKAIFRAADDTNNTLAVLQGNGYFGLGSSLSNPTAHLSVLENGGNSVYAASFTHNGGTVGRNGVLISTTGTSSGTNALLVTTGTSTYTLLATGDGRIGLGTNTIGSTLQVNGNVAIGFSSSTAASTNGLRVAGTVTLDTGLTVTTGGVTVSGGGATITGTTAVTGALSSTGNTTLASGAGANTVVGNTTGTIQLESTTFDLSTAGTINTAGGYLQSGVVGNTLSGATSFTATGTAVSVTNSASVGDTLVVGGSSATAHTGSGGNSLYGHLTVNSATRGDAGNVYDIGWLAGGQLTAALGHVSNGTTATAALLRTFNSLPLVIDVNGTESARFTSSGITMSGTINSQTISSSANFTGTLAVATSVSTPIIQSASGALSVRGANGIVNINTSGTQNYLRVYDSGGTKYGQITHDGTNGIVSSSSGELQLQGQGTNQFILGDVGTAVNLVFEESSTISGQGANTITLGQSGDIFNLNTTGVTYNIGTLSSTGATLSTSSTSTTALVINGPSGLGSSLLDLQVNSASKLSVSSTGTIATSGAITSSVTGANALALTGAPAASASSSLLQLGSAIGSGSASGTFIGVNAANGYAGNLADLQVNGSSKFKIDASGNSTVGGTLGVTGATTLSAAGAASTPALSLTGAIYTGGTGTTNFPAFLIQPTGATAATTWSTSGTALGVNTASGFAGNLADMRVAGASKFSVDASGNTTFGGNLTVSGSGTHAFSGTIRVSAITSSGALTVTSASNGNINLAPNGSGKVTLGDGGTSNYAQFDSTGVLTFNGSARPSAEIILNPADATEPGAANCAISSTDDTNFAFKTLDCADTGSDVSATWQFRMPQNYVSGTNIEVTIFWQDPVNPSSGNVVYDLSYASVATGGTFAGVSATTLGNTTTSASGGQNILNSKLLTLTTPSINSDNQVLLRLIRKGSLGGDTLGNPAKIVSVRVKFIVGS